LAQLRKLFFLSKTRKLLTSRIDLENLKSKLLNSDKTSKTNAHITS
jgi:hypothetical protein